MVPSLSPPHHLFLSLSTPSADAKIRQFSVFKKYSCWPSKAASRAVNHKTDYYINATMSISFDPYVSLDKASHRNTYLTLGLPLFTAKDLTKFRQREGEKGMLCVVSAIRTMVFSPVQNTTRTKRWTPMHHTHSNYTSRYQWHQY